MDVKLMDCTLRDGANVVGKGFSAQLTDLMLDGLTACRIPIIEFGNAGESVHMRLQGLPTPKPTDLSGYRAEIFEPRLGAGNVSERQALP